MTDNRYIPGIFNYCDYWCERCAFTRRCRNFAMGQEQEREGRDDTARDDAVRQDFWNRLAGELRETRIRKVFPDGAELLDEPEDAGDVDPELEKRLEDQHKASREHPLAVMARDYAMKVADWLKSADNDLRGVAEELRRAAHASFVNDDLEEEALAIGDMIEVVTWYHTLISAKTGRAVSGLLQRKREAGFAARLGIEDANGTGKVVLAAVERSMAAWLRLREILPQREGEILDLLALLSRIQYGIHAALPGAKAFIRPGFDEVP